MTLLHYLSYVSAVVAFLFVTLSLASGLLWLAEVIEENSKLAKLVGQRAVYAVIILHCILYFTDSLPLPHTLFSIGCHVIYLLNFSPSWPLIALTAPQFLASCLLVIIDHFLWFFYFSQKSHNARTKAHRPSSYRVPPPPGRYGSTEDDDTVTFAQIATFFGLCVWLVPLFLFLSLSANDNALPTLSADRSNQQAKSKSDSLISPPTSLPQRSLFKSLYDTLPGVRRLRHASSEGIIAPPPRSPSLTVRRTTTPIPTPLDSLNNTPILSPDIGAPPRSPSWNQAAFEAESLGRPGLKLNTPPGTRRMKVGNGDGGRFSPRRVASENRVGLGLGRMSHDEWETLKENEAERLKDR